MTRRNQLQNSNLFVWMLAGAIFCTAAYAQQQPSAQEMVRQAIQNEMADTPHSHLYTWKERKIHGHDSEVSDVVETPEGDVSRVLLINDKPLNADQRKAEADRIRKMLEPSQLAKKKKDQQEDDQRTKKMLSTIPDAFDFQVIGSRIAPDGHKITQIRFTAKPGFSPPSREAQVFTGMRGEMTLDESAHRLLKIDGKLFKEVDFGWGILGKLYPGGEFLVEQAEVCPGHWDTTRMVLHFDGKALFIKPIHVDDNETDWNYQPVQPMNTAQAMNFLNRSQPAQSASIGH